MSTGFKPEARIANILTAVFLNQHDFKKAKRLLDLLQFLLPNYSLTHKKAICKKLVMLF